MNRQSIEQECREAWAEAEHWHFVAQRSVPESEGGLAVFGVTMTCAAAVVMFTASYAIAHNPEYQGGPNLPLATIFAILGVTAIATAVAFAVRGMRDAGRVNTFVRELRGWL